MNVALKLIFRRLFLAFLSLFFIATLTFILMKSVPGDPFNEERGMPKEILAQIKKNHGLDRPLYVQYVDYLKCVVTLDFGSSLKYNARSVHDIIKQGFPISALLGSEALIIALLGGLTLGTFAAIGQSKWSDKTIFILSILGLSMPSFIAATFLQYFLAIYWPIFPIAQWNGFEYSILPALSLSLVPMAFIAKLFRASILEVISQPYIQMAKARGLSSTTIVISYIWKNSILPIMNYLSLLATNLLVGSCIVEKIFGIPGLGQWFVSSVSNRDYPIIAGLTLFYSAILLLFGAVSEIAHQWIDPRHKELHNPH